MPSLVGGSLELLNRYTPQRERERDCSSRQIYNPPSQTPHTLALKCPSPTPKPLLTVKELQVHRGTEYFSTYRRLFASKESDEQGLGGLSKTIKGWTMEVEMPERATVR